MKRWLAAIPLIALLALGGLAASQLLQPEKPGFEEADLRPAPDMVFPILESGTSIAFAPPPGGLPIAVNLFASWCGPCEAEHPLLVELAERFPAQVYGIAYKDRPEDTVDFLTRLGDPYTEVAVDADGQGGLEFGLTGVPETFVISSDGQIVLHVRGQLVPDDIATIRELLKDPSQPGS